METVIVGKSYTIFGHEISSAKNAELSNYPSLIDNISSAKLKKSVI